MVIGIGGENVGRCRRAGQKGTILEFPVWHGGAGSILPEDGCESSDVGICLLYRGWAQAPHLHAQYPSMEEAAIMMGSATKKDAHAPVEIHYNKAHHEQTLHGGLALQSLQLRPCSGPIPG